MKASRLISLTVLLSIQAAVTTAFAQDKPKAGDTISGIIREESGPMMMVNVTERDSSDRIVAHTITDMAGEFSFRLVNPDDRIQITYVGYEKVDIPIDKTFFEIKMNEEELIDDDSTTPDTSPRGRGIIGSDSYTMGELQKNAPQDYVCGYVMKNPWGTYLYGIYLVKEGKQYSMVYKKSDYTESRRIKSRQAKELISSVESKIAYADTPNTANTVRSNGVVIHVVTFYDGNTAYVVTPDKAAYFWTSGSEDIPDEAWQEEYLKFINEKKTVSAQHEFVDLGLSVKWATCNVGASKPEEVGGLFAWGETETKSDYSYSTYKFSATGSKGSYTKYSKNDNKTELELEDDVAHVKWGGGWRMPTWEEMQELIKECKWTWTEVNGIEGFRFTSKKPGYEDRSIFLPVNQYSDAAALAEGMYPSYGAYWSSTLCQDQLMFMMADRDHAWGYYFCRDYPLGNGSYRNEGRSVRPVCP